MPRRSVLRLLPLAEMAQDVVGSNTSPQEGGAITQLKMAQAFAEARSRGAVGPMRAGAL